MHYCDGNQTISQAWVESGLSHCFVETITGATLCGIMLIFGSIQLLFYRRYATPIDPRLRPKSLFFRMQVLVVFILLLLLILRFALQAQYLYDRRLSGYMIFTVLAHVVAWSWSLVLLMQERTRILPSIPSRGHGLVLLTFWTMAFVAESLPFASLNSPDWWWRRSRTSDHVEFALWLCRYLCVCFLFIVGFKAPGLPNYRQWYSLLQEAGGDLEAGSGPEQASTWRNVFKKLRQLGPYIWPAGKPLLQLRVFLCVLILVAGRFVNVLQPLYNKYIVDSLTPKTSQGPNNSTITSRPLYMHETTVYEAFAAVTRLVYRWDLVLIWVLLRSLQGIGVGGSGLMNTLRSFLWIRVSQYTTKEVSIRLFSHLHGLSLKWHLSKKTGEVLRIMDRGTNSINGILNYVIFSIAPTIIDIIIGIIYFAAKFNIWFGLIVFVTMVVYIVATITITEWRTKFRRTMNQLDNKTNAFAVDSLLNFETVKYYGAEETEVQRYRSTIEEYMDAEWTSTATLNLLGLAQNIVINSGFLAGTLLCAYFIVQGEDKLTVGDFVLFSSYIIQLYGPLNWFGTYYRTIQQNFIDMENMFDLLEVNRDVEDAPNARPLIVTNAEVTFDNVHFRYTDEREILKGISFTIPPGKTFALVGHSGSGKSTIVRLLFRFYDVNEGRIIIDNQDISKVKQDTLRRAIGVVPQDTVLFNSDIRSNILFGRHDATEEEMEAAAMAADIHERICSFPDGYETVVGERGLKLSGGEKQRVAIARTLLKAPRIVLLDEATSALDTKTERNIQSSLDKMCVGRTTLVVAHRLSTIIGADQILVMKEGEVVERGSHSELLAKDGLYAALWLEQQREKETNDGEEEGGESSSSHDK